MSDPGRGTLRAVRGATLALACTLIALAGHVLGGGDAPPLGALGAVTLLVGATFVILAHKQRAFGQIFVAAAATQLAFHSAFTLSSGAYGHVLHDEVPLTSPSMLTGHLVAAAVTAAFVATGEQAVWAIHRLSVLVRLPELTVVRPVAVPAFRPVPARDPHPRDLLLNRTTPRRGPPCCR